MIGAGPNSKRRHQATASPVLSRGGNTWDDGLAVVPTRLIMTTYDRGQSRSASLHSIGYDGSSVPLRKYRRNAP